MRSHDKKYKLMIDIIDKTYQLTTNKQIKWERTDRDTYESKYMVIAKQKEGIYENSDTVIVLNLFNPNLQFKSHYIGYKGENPLLDLFIEIVTQTSPKIVSTAIIHDIEAFKLTQWLKRLQEI